MNIDWLRVFEVLLIIGVLVVIGVIVAVYFAIRRLQHFVAPDLPDMQRRLEQLRRSRPGATNEQLVHTIIRQQALKCGLVGALTGLGGFVTLPIALPVDILASMRIQATMVQFIALIYGQSQLDSNEVKLQTYLVMSGGLEVTETTFNVIMKIVARIVGESLAILIPAIGAVVGFAVNYLLAQTTGNLALRWYSTRHQQPPAISAAAQRG